MVCRVGLKKGGMQVARVGVGGQKYEWWIARELNGGEKKGGYEE